jgi:hypothetical protein
MALHAGADIFELHEVRVVGNRFSIRRRRARADYADQKE